MTEIGSSIAEAIKKRTASAAIGTYGFFWVTLHSQGIYVTLFTSEEIIYDKFGLTKTEYVYKYFFGLNDSNVVEFLAGIVVPAILTTIFLTVFSKYVLNWFYGIEQSHKVERRIKKMTHEQKILAVEKNLAQAEKKTYEAQKEAAEEAAQVEQLDPTYLWERDYKSFEQAPAYSSFGEVINAVYEERGRIRNSSSGILNVSSDVLAMADSFGLIDADQRQNTINLTDKGKYFVRRFNNS